MFLVTIMKAFIFILLAFNFSVEAGRVYDVSFQSVKEVKIKKIDKQIVVKLSGINRGRLC